jgi:hypothetical protein
MMITYTHLNSIWLAEPPHHLRKPLTAVPVEMAGYPIVSTTNQRRRKLTGHRGCGEKQEPVIRLGSPDDKGLRPKQQLRIWRGFDKRVAIGMVSRYDGEALRAIRVLKGVGRPVVSEVHYGSNEALA